MTAPRLPPDFADLLTCLNEAKVEYMIIGGYAVMVHGYLRATQDLDVWVRPSPDNAARVIAAMEAFGISPRRSGSRGSAGTRLGGSRTRSRFVRGGAPGP